MNSGWLSRTEMLIGGEAMKKLQASSVLIVGLGGVGSWAAEMICRAGTGSLTIADGDRIHTSNRNRQLAALTSTEGLLKADVMGQRLKDINPGMNLTVIPEFIRGDRIADILGGDFDYVVDAIDTLTPKVFLLYNCLQRGIPVVSSMGSGGKFDTEQVQIRDISETINCNLARILRKRLHRLGITEGVKAVFSPEVVDKSKVSPAADEPNKASRVGTISYMPAAFGIACASVVIRDLAGIPVS